MEKATLSIHGVRGSIPAVGPQYMIYGGNTSSYTLRTPAKSLIFLDAGTGMQTALKELDEQAQKVVLALSHSHADHVQGLAMPDEDMRNPLPWLTRNTGYENQKVTVIGPKEIRNGLAEYYSGKYVWPVPTSWMASLDLANVVEASDGHVTEIDSSTQIRTMYGNHPVEGGVVLYRIDLDTKSGLKSVVFATDNEFDWLGPGKINPNASALKDSYVQFVRGANVLLADAQYGKEQYLTGIPKNVQGFGHTYAEQIIDLAAQAGVKLVLPTHHDRWNDERLSKKEATIGRYGKDAGLEVVLAREGMKVDVESGKLT